MGVQSSVIQGILRGKLLCNRSSQQVSIGSDEYRGREMVRLDCLSGHHGSGQWHSIVAPESMALGQLYGAIDDQTIHWEKQKVVHTVLQEATQAPLPLRWREATGCPLLRCQCGGHCCEGDLREQHRVLYRGLCDLQDPGAARSLGRTLHQGTDVDGVVGHFPYAE